MSTIPSTGQLGGTPTNAQFQGYIEDFRDFIIESLLGASARYELTIASGAVTPPDGATAGGGVYKLDTEGNAASDTLDTIVQTNTHDGQILIVMAENAARVVTLTNAAGGAGQMLLAETGNFVFASTSAWVAFRRDGTDWVELMRYVPTEDLTALTAPDIADLLEIWDDSAGTTKRISTALVGRVVQAVEATPYTTHTTYTTTMDFDTGIPGNTEGVEMMTVSITPTKATHRLRIEVSVVGAPGSATSWAAALFQDSTSAALRARGNNLGVANQISEVNFWHEMAAGTTSATTFKVRVGASTGNFYPNGISSGIRLGGVSACTLRVTEFVA